MDTNLQQHHQHQMSSGLTRYRSAPSSYFGSLLSSSSSSSVGGGYLGDHLDHHRYVFSRQNSKNFAATQQSTMTTTMPSDFWVSSSSSLVTATQQQQVGGDFPFVSKKYQSQIQAQQHQHPHNNNNLEVASSTSPMDNSYRLVASLNAHRPVHMNNTGGRTSSLIRHSSSPAGLFDQINIESEYGALRGGMGGAGNNSDTHASLSSSTWFKKDMDFSSTRSSSLGRMTPISEIEAKPAVGNDGSGKRGDFDETHRNGDKYLTGFPDVSSSWDDSAILSDDFLKGLEGDNNQKLFSSVSASDRHECGEGQIRPPLTRLSHHLSLPASSAEFSDMEKLSEDTVLCKIRAKRGCATHPRSIAERVRRTRISERMRKLQELVPNMDKQTNTADMLDLAADYIKDLEKELKALQGNRGKCTCVCSDR